MDFAEQLRAESLSGHAQFHEYALGFAKKPSDSFFLFFEGEDDPIFYVGFLIERLAGRAYQEFICMGRDQVLKAHELVARDGRARGRALFFVDKDLTDLFGEVNPSSDSIFQTDFYSFENYISCEVTVRRYWVERLRLRSSDPRYLLWLEHLRRTHAKFMRRSRLLMGLVLIGRGVDGRSPVKLNLNNANLDNVFQLRADAGELAWHRNGLAAFIAAIGLTPTCASVAELRCICRTHLKSEPKSYVRGKYELWFFVKFLQAMTRQLSDRRAAAAADAQRAKPVEALTQANSIAMLSSLVPIPNSLRDFVEAAVAARRIA